MIAFSKKLSRKATRNTNDKFIEMIPLIHEQAQLAFRGYRPEAKEELIAAVVADAFCAFRRLVLQGKKDIAFASPLARYAIRHVRAGRRVGTKFNVRDVTSEYALRVHGIKLQRLDEFDDKNRVWHEALVEDRNAGPAETAAARIDVTKWFRTLNRQKRRIAKLLANGEMTSTVALMVGVTAARVSQLRQELKRSWEEFQGEPTFA